MTSGSYGERVMTSGSYGTGVMTSGSYVEGVITSDSYGVIAKAVMDSGSWLWRVIQFC